MTFLHSNERGSIITASNVSGAATASVKYGSYGESGGLVSPFGYTGQLYMQDLQLYYYKARMYSPQTGRFLQPDPTGYEDNTNLYAYVDGDPVNLSDSSGLDWRGNCWFAPKTTFSGSSGDPNVPVAKIEADQEPLFCAPSQLPFAVPSIPSGNIGLQAPGHSYQTQNVVCSRPLTDQERRDLISRFTVPNVYTQDQPKTSGGTYLVAGTSGIPGGWVTTTFSADGLFGKNDTTPFHMLSGSVVRTIGNTPFGAYMVTQGFGGYPPSYIPPSTSAGMLSPMDLGAMIDSLNDIIGPEVFNDVDSEAAQYAKSHFAGC